MFSSIENWKIRLFENVIPLHFVKKLQEDLNIDIVKNKSVFLTFGHRNGLESIGFVILKCLICEKISNIKFIVLNVNDSPILGFNTCLNY